MAFFPVKFQQFCFHTGFTPFLHVFVVLLLYSIRLDASLFEVLSFIAPDDIVFRNDPCRFRCVILGFVPVPSHNAASSLAMTSMTYSSLCYVFHLWVLLAGSIFLRPVILLTWLIAHELR